MSNSIKEYKYNVTITHAGSCMILGHIISQLKQEQSFTFLIDREAFCHSIEKLNLRMTKTVMEIIQDYRASNREAFVVMGKDNNTGYGGNYNNVENSTTYDITKLPDSLVIILYKFIELNKQYKT